MITSSTLAPATTSTLAALATTSTAVARIATTPTPARTVEGLTSRSGAVPAVVGVPRTGGDPLPDPRFPWLAVVLGGLTAGAVTAGALRLRRRADDTVDPAAPAGR